MTNQNLNAAKSAKNDEFYTQLSDIENELQYYEQHFKDKTVYCNCDDPKYSQFWKYFKDNFDKLGLKKLICSYHGENASVTTYMRGGEKTELLNGNGDFRSPECIDILKTADIIVTNPPFSLFRDFISILIRFEKQFLVLGNSNALTYRDIFPLVVKNKIKTGVNCGQKIFDTPNGIQKFGNIVWFTNLRFVFKKYVTCTKNYSPELYPKYDNYNAIEVSKINNIPKDYFGIMGVSISILNKYSPDQFEIVGELKHGCDNEYDFAKPILNGKELFTRILIRHKT